MHHTGDRAPWPTVNQTSTAATAKTDADYSREQAALCAQYQAALAAAGGDRRGVDQTGRQALADLLESISGKLHFILTEQAKDRFGEHVPGEVYEEAYAEMAAAVITAAADYDPDRCGSFHGWVTGSRGPARIALKIVLDAHGGSFALPQQANDARRSALAARDKLRERLGREPTLAEIQDDMREYAINRKVEQLARTETGMSPEELRQEAHRRVRRSGWLARIEEAGDLLAASRVVLVDDFAPLEDPDPGAFPGAATDGPELGQLSGMLAVVTGGLSTDDAAIVTDLFTGTDSVAKVAAAHQSTPGHVTDLKAATESRRGAAHAHYAFLAPGLLDQFEQAPTRSRRTPWAALAS
jgi:hypothetical protein